MGKCRSILNTKICHWYLSQNIFCSIFSFYEFLKYQNCFCFWNIECSYYTFRRRSHEPTNQSKWSIYIMCTGGTDSSVRVTVDDLTLHPGSCLILVNDWWAFGQTRLFYFKLVQPIYIYKFLVCFIFLFVFIISYLFASDCIYIFCLLVCSSHRAVQADGGPGTEDAQEHTQQEEGYQGSLPLHHGQRYWLSRGDNGMTNPGGQKYWLTQGDKSID